MIDDAALAEAVHDTGIRRLQSAYADAVNRRAWGELDSMFVEGASVTIDRRSGAQLSLVGGAEVGEFIGAAIAGFEFFEFVILNASIAFPDGPEAGWATCRLFMCEIRQQREGGQASTAFGLYHDRYANGEGGWRFAARSYHSLARTARSLDVFPLPVEPGLEVPGFAPPPTVGA